MKKYQLILASFIACAVLCISAGSAAEDMFRFIKFKGKVVKWGKPALGTPAKLSYYILEKEHSFDKLLDKGRCKRMIPLSKALERSGMPHADFEHETEKAFESWSRITNVTFVQAASFEEADIVIGALFDPRYKDIAFTNIALESSKDAKVASIRKAVICINPLLEWRIVSSNTEKMPSVGRALKHEIGHVIGLGHSSKTKPPTVMAYNILGFVEFAKSDILGAQYLYGLPAKTAPPK